MKLTKQRVTKTQYQQFNAFWTLIKRERLINDQYTNGAADDSPVRGV